MSFSDLIQGRQSVRKYQSRKPDKAVLQQVMEAAQQSPSAVNFQPWQFLVLSTEPLLSSLKDCYHRQWINDAPVCIVALGDHQASWHRQADGKDHCDIDVSIAITHLTLQAAELGLGTCWVCNFEVEKVRSLLKLSEHMEPIALIPIGYPAADVEVKERERKPFNDIVKWM